MQTLKSLTDQSLLIWNDATGAGRIGIALLLLICIGGVVGIGVWSAQPNYVALTGDISPNQAAKLIGALESEGISYQVTGSIIMVDKQKWSRAKIAAGQLGLDNPESQMEETSPWMDPVSQQNTFRRNLERRLENSIARFKNVSSAEVHLSMPEKQAFIRQSTAPSAAVILEISGKSKFSEANALSIASMVASSVPGLTDDNVAISDTSGNEYATDSTLGQLNKQEEFRVMRDRELAHKAQAILTPFLGIGNASVAVTTDFTFPMGTKTTRDIDPESKVLIDETINNSTTTTGDDSAVGVAGAASNLESTKQNLPKRGQVLSKTEDLSNKYDVSSSSSTETIQTPILNMMTVSVLVNQSTVQDENNAIPPKVKQKVESLVSQAVGLRSGKDLITVEFFEFIEPEVLEPPAASALPWDQINEVLKNISLGVAALVALFIGLKIIKKFNPDAASSVADAGERTTKLSELSEMVKENPEVFAKIIASWSNVDADEQDEPPAKAA
jgi:flagellar M-ring protein FliF